MGKEALGRRTVGEGKNMHLEETKEKMERGGCGGGCRVFVSCDGGGRGEAAAAS